MDGAISRLRADGLTQPVLLRVQSNYYVKTDNTAILIADCSCFAEAAEFLFACFFVFFLFVIPLSCATSLIFLKDFSMSTVHPVNCLNFFVA